MNPSVCRSLIKALRILTTGLYECHTLDSPEYEDVLYHLDQAFKHIDD